jgi:hypothetical protein
MPELFRTEIPGSQYSVSVFGPDESGEFHYTIWTIDTKLAFAHVSRSLGSAPVDPIAEPIVVDNGNGIYRVQWGTKSDSAFVTIDSRDDVIVDDSNAANSTNTPIPPRNL